MDLAETVERLGRVHKYLLNPDEDDPGTLRTLGERLDRATDPAALDEKEARDEAYELADVDLLVRDAKRYASEIHKIADKLERRIAARLPELLVQAEMPRVDRKGYAFHPTTKLYVKPLGGYSDERLLEFLRRHGRGDLVKTAVSNQALRSALIEMRDEAGGELPQEILDELEGVAEITTVSSLSVRKA